MTMELQAVDQVMKFLIQSYPNELLILRGFQTYNASSQFLEGDYQSSSFLL